MHGSSSSRVFQTSASRPPGRRTRAISGSATAWSNQWNAWPEATTSADASGSGMISAVPGSPRARKSGVGELGRASPASGSTAVTRCPRATSARLSFPVPAPRSTTSRGSSPASQRTASSGYPGRPRSYASATPANTEDGPASVGRGRRSCRDLRGAVPELDEARHDVEHALSRAERDVVLELGRVLEQVAPALRRTQRLLRPGPRGREAGGGLCRVRAPPAEELDDAAGDVGVVERERALDAGADDDRVVPARASPRRRRPGSGATPRGRARTAPRRRRRPACRSSSTGRASTRRLEVLARRVPEVEAGDAHGVPLASEDAVAEPFPERPSLLDVGRAEDPLVPRVERLAHRRGGADDVDHDPGRSRTALVGCERDVNQHRGTLAAVDEALRCYRHPERETYVSCTECGRGICPDCMNFGPVGIRCPDHAGAKVGRRRRSGRARRATTPSRRAGRSSRRR